MRMTMTIGMEVMILTMTMSKRNMSIILLIPTMMPLTPTRQQMTILKSSGKALLRMTCSYGNSRLKSANQHLTAEMVVRLAVL